MGIIKWLFAKKRRLIILVALIVGGFLFWKFVLSGGKNGAETVTIERGEVSEELILSGSVQADEHASLKFLSSGELDYMAVAEGDRVEKGQILARLDTFSLNAAYESAFANLRSAEASLAVVYDDVKDHDDDESLSQREERTAAEAAKDVAYRNYEIARKNLSNATLRAPFAGIVTAITYPYTQIATSLAESQIEIVNPETMYFDVAADQSEVIDLSEGQDVVLILDSFPDYEFKGKIANISYTPKSGEVGAVYQVKVAFEAMSFEAGTLRLGMTGDAKFVLNQKEDVLYVPPKFVNSDTKGKYVNKGKKNGKVYVEVGLEGEERVEISGDMAEGDTLYD